MLSPLYPGFKTNNDQFLIDPPSIDRERAAVEVELEGWLTHAELLTPTSRHLFIRHVQSIADDIVDSLRKMACGGASSESIARETERSIAYLQDAAQLWLQHKGCYEEKREEISFRMDQFQAKLGRADVHFASFSVSPSKQSESSAL